MGLIKEASKIKPPLIVLMISLTVIGITTLASKSTGAKGTLNAVLQSDLNLSSPSNSVYAISTSDQQLPDGSTISRGTKFIGMSSVEGDHLVIFFDSIQTLDGQTQQFIGKLNISKIEDKQASGVSAKIGKTLYNQSKSNVLGAIFHNPGSGQDLNLSVLPKGSTLKIELD